MKLRPLADRVIVKQSEAEEKTKSGIVLPDTAKEKPTKGKVIAVGPGKLDDKGKPMDKPEEITTKGMPLPEAVKKITGPPGTKVKITVDREGADKPLEFEITRG